MILIKIHPIALQNNAQHNVWGLEGSGCCGGGFGYIGGGDCDGKRCGGGSNSSSDSKSSSG